MGAGVPDDADPARPDRVRAEQAESDGHTPVGEFGIGGFMFGGRPNPGVRYPYRRLQVGDWWDEHVGSPTYNSFQHATGVPPFAARSEPLWRILLAYDYAAVIAYNMSPVVQRAGSGIFLHVGAGGRTAGCVSLARDDLLTVLRWLDPAARPVIAMGPSPWILRG